MNKEYEITELMRDYTDDEFNIEGENAADTERVAEIVMAKVKEKKRIKPMYKVLIAAAAAAVLAMGAAAATTGFMSGSYTTASGIVFDYKFSDDGDYLIEWERDAIDGLMTLEDGRLYLNIADGHTDITDLIDRQTPYIYSYTVSGLGATGYVIAGGTAEEYGVVELTYLKGTGWHGYGAYNGSDQDLHVSVWDDGANRMFGITGYPGDGEGYHSHFDGFVPPEWREECPDAWIIEALLQLDLIELYE